MESSDSAFKILMLMAPYTPVFDLRDLFCKAIDFFHLDLLEGGPVYNQDSRLGRLGDTGRIKMPSRNPAADSRARGVHNLRSASGRTAGPHPLLVCSPGRMYKLAFVEISV